MKKRIDLPQVSDVTLPEVFHLRPGIWILIILAILVAIFVFLLCFLPGIVKGGRYVTFFAPLSESGITIDGTYLGSADHQYFIQSGEHQVVAVKGGVAYATETITIDHPLFLTALIHRTREVAIHPEPLSEQQKLAIIGYDLEEIQKASAILQWTMVNRYAPVYSNLTRDLDVLKLDAATEEDAIALSLYYITSTEMLEDATDAFKDRNDGKIGHMLTAARQVITQGAATTTVQARTLPSTKTHESTLTTDLFTIEGTGYPAITFTMGNDSDHSYPAVKERPVTITTPPFALANLPVSLTEWAHFIEENPKWAKSNKDALVQEALADTSYLSGLAPSTIFVTSRALTNVSYRAALAFCAWLTEKSGKEVFLPTEAMYSAAALNHPNLAYHTSLTPGLGSENPAMLLGGVWEITQTPFIPLSRLFDYEEALRLHSAFGLEPSPIVKGGSYLNDGATITADTVGTIPPYASGDQIGFRIAWYE